MWRLLFPVLLGTSSSDLPSAFVVDAPAKAEPYTLVECVAKGQPSDAAVIWDVSPEDTASVRELQGGRLVFTGPPGTYRVKCRAIVVKDGATSVQSARASVVIGSPAPQPPAPMPPGKPTFDPVGATVRLRHGNSGCSATIMHPRRSDGSWDVLTASHCTGNVGTVVALTLKDGRTTDAKVTARDTQSDISWLRTARTDIDNAPCALLADKAPQPGAAVWHVGYGIDRPGNREDGVVEQSRTTNGQLAFTLSVSPGDSGAGIFLADSSNYVATVCCTESFARKVRMYGGSCEVAKRLRP